MPDLNKVAQKITDALANFFKKEEDIQKTTREMVNEAIKESTNKKIEDIKNKINQL